MLLRVHLVRTQSNEEVVEEVRTQWNLEPSDLKNPLNLLKLQRILSELGRKLDPHRNKGFKIQKIETDNPTIATFLEKFKEEQNKNFDVILIEPTSN